MDDEKGKRSSISSSSASPSSVEEIMDVRRGPWTVEEDMKLINYIAAHAEGRWNSLARAAGLKRTGKSCRLRWLNYLRPDVRRGNITLQEQLLILQLHSRWGNRWSKIAEQLPGRTDNEIKNYWRTRVQKHAKQLRCDVNSKQFKDTVRCLWMPRLLERIHASAADHHTTQQSSTTVHSAAIITPEISSSTATAAAASSASEYSSVAPQTHSCQTSTTHHVPVNANIISNTDDDDDDDQNNLQFAAAAGQQAIGDYSNDSSIPPTSFITNNTGPLDFYGRSLLDDQNASWTTNDVCDASISNHQLGLCYTNDDFWSTSFLHQQYLNY